MTNPHGCPLCQHGFAAEIDLRVHLEVEHRKSELARFVVEDGEQRVDPTVERLVDEADERGEPPVERDVTAPSA